MNEAQLFLLLGSLYIAPHCDKWYGLFVGAIFTAIAVLKGWGLI